MARDFDGANDNIAFGSDASIDAFAVQAICLWVHKDTTGFQFWVGKDRFAAVWGLGDDGTGSGKLYFERQWNTTNGTWNSTTALGTTAPRHVAVVYDTGATTNDPVFYLDGAVDTTVELTAPSTLTATSDATPNLRAGETGGNGADFDGRIGWLVYHNATLTAADVNRARYWGRPFGGLKVYHPWMTTKLTNEGTATATGTASGTTVVAMAVPVVRPGTAMMGLGVGW